MSNRICILEEIIQTAKKEEAGSFSEKLLLTTIGLRHESRTGPSGHHDVRTPPCFGRPAMQWDMEPGTGSRQNW